MHYALTINFNHECYDSDIEVVSQKIIQLTSSTYCEVVNHAYDHYHALIETDKILNKDTFPFTYAHYDVVRNIKAYQKYMYNHDVTTKNVWGEMGYHEKPNTDDMINYAIQYGLNKTVLKYGMQALRVYNQLKSFLENYKKGD